MSKCFFDRKCLLDLRGICTRLTTLVDIHTSDTMQQTLVHVTALEQIHRPVRTRDIDIIQRDITASVRTRANDVARIRRILVTRDTSQVPDLNITDSQTGGKLIAERQVLLAIALRNLDGVVHIRHRQSVVRDVVDATQATASLEITRERRGRARPDLDARQVTRVEHGDVVHEDVLDDIRFAGVLAEGSDADAVAAVAVNVLDQDLGAVGLEAHAVVSVVYDAVLDDNVAAAVRVPAVGVLCQIGAAAIAANVYIVKDDVGAVGYEIVPLGRVAEFQVGDRAAFEANGSE